MKIQSIKTVYFSATGNTKNVVKLIGETIARNMNLSYKEIDFTLPQAHKDSYEFTKEELVIFGTPVYAGRVPNKVLPMIQGLFQGNDAFAVPVVTFGNRNYDNALIELRNELENNHFHTIAAGAFVAQHAFTDQLATMRPDKSDQEEIRGFAINSKWGIIWRDWLNSFYMNWFRNFSQCLYHFYNHYDTLGKPSDFFLI